MKKLFILLLLALVASVYVAGKIQQDPGYILISYKNTSVETSLWVGIVLLVLTVALVYFALWFLHRLLGTGKAFRRWSSNISHRRSISKSAEGLIALQEGEWIQAQKKLTQAAKNSELPVFNYLSAARAASENNDDEAANALFAKAYELAPQSELAISLTKAELLIQKGEYEKARAALELLKKTHGKHKRVHILLYYVYLRLEDWKALNDLLPMLRKLRISLTGLDQLEEKAVLQSIEIAANEEFIPAPDRAVAVRDIWNKTPVRIRRQEASTLAYVNALKNNEKGDWAEPAIRDAIKAEWSEALVEQYGLIEGKGIANQLSTAEKWLKQQPESPALLLALGRLSLRNKLWGKAREYFLARVKVAPSTEAYAELGRLLEHMGDTSEEHEQALKSFQLTKAELPALPLPEPQLVDISKSASL